MREPGLSFRLDTEADAVVNRYRHRRRRMSLGDDHLEPVRKFVVNDRHLDRLCVRARAAEERQDQPESEIFHARNPTRTRVDGMGTKRLRGWLSARCGEP